MKYVVDIEVSKSTTWDRGCSLDCEAEKESQENSLSILGEVTFTCCEGELCNGSSHLCMGVSGLCVVLVCLILKVVN